MSPADQKSKTAELHEKALRLPLKPGVYIMLDKSGAVIYVGKAKALKNRVSSYFRDSRHDLKTATMVSKVNDFNVIIADTEFEALILENSLIKLHKPRYNILLKDDKGYPYIRLDIKSEYPRFTVASKRAEDGAAYFGPFGGRNAAHEAIETVSKTLGLPQCSRKFPRDIGKERPCLNKHMGYCAGWCAIENGAEAYRKTVDEAAMIFNGHAEKLAAQLEKEMLSAAAEFRFERAAELRDRMRAVEKLKNRQRIVGGSKANMDAVGFFRGGDKSCFVVMHYIGGTLLDKDYMLLDAPVEDDGEAVSALLRAYYMRRGSCPKLVLLPWDTGDAEQLAELFSQESGTKVEVSIPKKGEKRVLVETAVSNAEEESKRAEDKKRRAAKSLEWLAKALGLEFPPERIEAYDISNTAGEDNVASMAVLKGGKPARSEYRRFKIKTVEGQDDYASMREAVRRRMERMLQGDEKFSEPPQLILADGGQGHAHAVSSLLRELGLDIPVFGMVKDERHRTRALVSPAGQEIGIQAQPAVFAMIGNLQEEAHRFAIEYHRKLGNKALRRSALDGIAGVGEKRKAELLKKFGSVKAIKAASVEQLRSVLPENAARAVYEKFREAEEEK